MGAVIDSASEDSESCIWYRIENKKIIDDYFINDNTPRNIDNFRVYNKEILTMAERTMRAVRKDYKGRFGRLEDNFLS